MKGLIKNISIQKKLAILIFILIISCSFLIGIILYKSSSQMMISKSISYIDDILQSTSTDIDREIEGLEQISKIIISNTNICALENIHSLNYSGQIDLLNKISRLLTNVVFSNKDIQLALLYDERGNLLQSPFLSSAAPNPLSPDDLAAADYSSATNLKYVASHQTDGITLVCMVRSIKNFKKTGYLQFNVRPEAIGNKFDRLLSQFGGNIYLFDNTGALILSDRNANDPDVSEFYTSAPSATASGKIVKVKGTSYIITSYTSSKTGFTTVAAIPKKNITGQLMQYTAVAVVILIFFIILSLLLTLVVARSISNPIIKIANNMKKFENGDFSVRSAYDGNDEIGYLSKSFNKLIIQTDKLVNEVYALKLLEKEQEIRLLQAQINPHFLYNTFDSINYLALEQGAENVSEMIIALSDLMRQSISAKPSLITINEDIFITNSYLRIMQMRIGDRLKINYDVDDDVMEFLIPRLTFQPIIENAIVHGFENKADECIITLTGHMKDNRIYLSVEDNGSGIAPEKLRDILDQGSQNKNIHSHIGLHLVDKRLKLALGGSSGLLIESTYLHGTKITLVLEKKLDREEAHV